MRAPVILFLALWLAGCGEQPPANLQLDSGGAPLTAVLSRDGSQALFSSTAWGLQLWQVASGKPRYRWTLEGDNQVLTAAMAEDGSVAVTAEASRFAVWDLQQGKNLGFYTAEGSQIRDIAISNGGRYVLLGQTNGIATHIDLDSGRRLQFVAHQHKADNIESAVTTVAMSANGRYCLTGGYDGNAFLWDSSNGQIVHAFRYRSGVIKVALERMGRYAFIADTGNNGIIWDLRTATPVSELQFNRRQLIITSARFSDDGSQLLTGSPGRQLRLWAVADGKLLAEHEVATRRELRPEGATVLDVAFGADGRLWSASSSGYVEYWPAPTGAQQP